MSDRISFKEGLKLFEEASLNELQQEAIIRRNQKNPKDRVSFVLDSNPNYTNVCNAFCSFCAFYRTPTQKEAYTKSVEEVMAHLEFARQAEITTVLLQGGLNDDLKMDYYVTLVKEARKRYPEIYPHFFTAPELYNCAKVSGVSIQQLLQALWDAGQRTIPGGGAEILSEKVRKKVSPLKMAPGAWAKIHQTAHQIGFKTTATMMYGHVETPEDILLHLETLRQMQDETSGFTAFIPWSYKPQGTALGRIAHHWAGKDAYFRILAFARIYLDNFDHIQASWFGEGKQIGMEALHYGADDFGGTILEENVHRATGHINKAGHNEMLAMIRKAGFRPVQRNPLYEILRTYHENEWVKIPEQQQKIIEEKEFIPVLHI